jgi:hypothetical protein
MPRNASGTYSLPSGNPVSSGTLIDANWANNTLNDLANEVTDSLSRSAEGGMLAPLRLTDGVQATPSLAFTNEPSTGLYRAGTNEAWFVTGGNQVAKFTSTGMEGRFAAGAAATPSLSAFGDVNTGLWFPAADTIAASVGGVEGWRLTSAGNLGIGTNAPGYPLSVVSAANGVVNVKGGSGTNQGSMFRVEAAGAASALAAFGDRARIFGGTPDALVSIFTSAAPLTFDVNGAERARLDSSGNLGIGTSSPGKNLEVAAATDTTIRIRNTTTNLSSAVFGTLDWATSDTSAPGGIVAKIDTFDDFPGGGGFGDRAAVRFFTNNGTALAERARITSVGSFVAGAQAALATTATDGFLYVPTCAGTPTGTPTAITGMAPIVVNTTNNKLYFYSGGAWRDAGP